MTPIHITLTAANMGPNASEADFDAWGAYVADHIGEALGIDAEVDQYSYRGGQADDAVRVFDEVKREEIKSWLSNDGWEAFCSAVDAVAVKVP